MAHYERSVRVNAPFESVWEFHATADGLKALTPDWMNLRVEEIRGPDGNLDPPELLSGSTLRASVRPFGVGPRQEWLSVITDRERSDGAGYFRDRMDDGPFKEWEHTHLFYADGDSTIVRDRIRYQLPFGPLGEIAGPLARVGFEPMFRFRHQRTRELLE